MDASLLHISYEGGVLEDPDFEPEESMGRITASPQKAPNKPEYVDLEYRCGDIVAVNGKKLADKEYLTNGYNIPSLGILQGSQGNPRTVTGTIEFKF